MRVPFSLGIAGIAWLCVCTAPMGAQQGGAPDAADVHARALRMVRDSAERVRGSIARFRRDLPMAGEQTVVGRAERLTQACEGLRAAFTDAVPLLRLAPSAHAGLVRARRDLIAAIRDTESVLLRECEQGLSATGPGEWADSLKAWGPYRTSQIQRSLSSIDAGIAGFARAADITLRPDSR